MCLPFAFCGAKSCNSPPGTEALKTAIAMDRNDVEAHNGIVTGSLEEVNSHQKWMALPPLAK